MGSGNQSIIGKPETWVANTPEKQRELLRNAGFGNCPVLEETTKLKQVEPKLVFVDKRPKLQE